MAVLEMTKRERSVTVEPARVGLNGRNGEAVLSHVVEAARKGGENVDLSLGILEPVLDLIQRLQTVETDLVLSGESGHHGLPAVLTVEKERGREEGSVSPVEEGVREGIVRGKSVRERRVSVVGGLAGDHGVDVAELVDTVVKSDKGNVRKKHSG